MTENTSRSSAQEIDTIFSRDCKNTNLDEEVDHDRAERPVVIGQPIGSSTTFNEVDIDFRVSGLPLVDKIFHPINNKIMPTTHLVKSPRR